MHKLMLLALSLMSLQPLAADVKFLATADCQFENGNQTKKSAADNSFNAIFRQYENDRNFRGILIAGDLCVSG